MMNNIPCKFDKHRGHKELLSMDHSSVRSIGCLWASTVTARYWKGVGADGDNVVLVIKEVTNAK